MQPDDHVCLCFGVSQRKLAAFLRRERPSVASRLSECLGAGTGCGWCVPTLEAMHAAWARGEDPAVETSPEEHAAGREVHRAARRAARAAERERSDDAGGPG